MSDNENVKRYSRGFNTNHLPTWLQERLKGEEQSKPLWNIIEAGLTIGSVPASAATSILLTVSVWEKTSSPMVTITVAVIAYVVVAVFIARQQRGLELMVHDASHMAWFRAQPKLNNFLANLLVAYPVLSSVEAYWKSHRIHHGQFGSHIDPCRQRFDKMGLATVDLSTKWKIAKAVLKWLPEYNRAYYEEIGSLSLLIWVHFFAWHCAIFMIPTYFLLWGAIGMDFFQASTTSVFLWFAFWMIPTTLPLPVLRSIAESEEHDYSKGETEFETTFTNSGFWQRFLFHPKNDAYHLVHHMFPNIPERRHSKIHHLLIKHDAKYRNSLHRSSILSSAI